MSPQVQDSILAQDMHPLSNLISLKSTQKHGKPSSSPLAKAKMSKNATIGQAKLSTPWSKKSSVNSLTNINVFSS